MTQWAHVQRGGLAHVMAGHAQPHVYSMGARQTISKLLGGHPDVHFNRRRSLRGSADYHATLREYTFCLSVTGSSFCPRSKSSWHTPHLTCTTER